MELTQVVPTVLFDRPLHAPETYEIDGLQLTSVGVHLVLGRAQRWTNSALYRISRCSPSHSILTYADWGNDMHRSEIDERFDFLGLADTVFISTMNPYVINKFQFRSPEDVRQRIIFAIPDGVGDALKPHARVQFMAPYQADWFFEATFQGRDSSLNTETLGTMGLW